MKKKLIEVALPLDAIDKASAQARAQRQENGPPLTKLAIRNFKLFDEVEIELAERVVFIGSNNSGKTSALQALALWHAGSDGGSRNAAPACSRSAGVSPSTAGT